MDQRRSLKIGRGDFGRASQEDCFALGVEWSRIVHLLQSGGFYRMEADVCSENAPRLVVAAESLGFQASVLPGPASEKKVLRVVALAPCPYPGAEDDDDEWEDDLDEEYS